MKMTLIFTDSYDATTDVLINYLPNANLVFRFNFDLFSSYSVKITPFDFEIEDPHGRKISRYSVSKAYYRKPSRRHFSNDENQFIEQEQWSAIKTLIDFVKEDKNLVLVEPFHERSLNKINQLRIAYNFFKVPETLFTNQPQSEDSNIKVVKSISNSNIGELSFYSRTVNTDQLKPSIPWYIQEYIEASIDITVVYVNGDCYGFSLDRSLLPEDVIDYKCQDELWDYWKPYVLSAELIEKICKYMFEMNLFYGRLDFLMEKTGELFFLEVNSNGQFAWLDIQNKTGMISRIVQEIDPLTEKNSIIGYSLSKQNKK